MVEALALLAIYLASWFSAFAIAKGLRVERYGLVYTPVYIAIKTQKFNDWIVRLALKGRKPWRVLWNVSAVVAPGLMAYAVYQLTSNLINLLFKVERAFSVQPIIPLPGIAVSLETFPYLIAAISITLISHELAHGLASVGDGVPIRSTGVFVSIIGLVGGFVEPDEEALNKARTASKLRVLAAGSTANALLGLLFLSLLANFSLTLGPFYEVVPSGVIVGEVLEGYPADKAGLTAGEVIQSVNGTPITNVGDLRRIMETVSPGETLRLTTDRGSYAITLAANPNNPDSPFIGIGGLRDSIAYRPKLKLLPPELPHLLLRLEFWTATVLLSVALINMLPIYPLDGEKYLGAILVGLGVKRLKMIRASATAVCLLILGLNLAFSFIRFGFVKM